QRWLVCWCNLHHPSAPRGCDPKPRVARYELPWVTVQQLSPTATRLRPIPGAPTFGSGDAIPLGLLAAQARFDFVMPSNHIRAGELRRDWASSRHATISFRRLHSSRLLHQRRHPFLRDKPARDALHSYLGGVSKQLDCPPILVGGVEDHIHLLARFGRTITQAEWVKELKRVSNLWLKERARDYADFEWQGGYADVAGCQSKLE